MSSSVNQAVLLNTEAKGVRVRELDLAIRMVNDTVACSPYGAGRSSMIVTRVIDDAASCSPYSAGRVGMKATRTVLAID